MSHVMPPVFDVSSFDGGAPREKRQDEKGISLGNAGFDSGEGPDQGGGVLAAEQEKMVAELFSLSTSAGVSLDQVRALVGGLFSDRGKKTPEQMEQMYARIKRDAHALFQDTVRETVEEGRRLLEEVGVRGAYSMSDADVTEKLSEGAGSGSVVSGKGSITLEDGQKEAFKKCFGRLEGASAHRSAFLRLMQTSVISQTAGQGLIAWRIPAPVPISSDNIALILGEMVEDSAASQFKGQAAVLNKSRADSRALAGEQLGERIREQRAIDAEKAAASRSFITGLVVQFLTSISAFVIAAAATPLTGGVSLALGAVALLMSGVSLVETAAQATAYAVTGDIREATSFSLAHAIALGLHGVDHDIDVKKAEEFANYAIMAVTLVVALCSFSAAFLPGIMADDAAATTLIGRIVRKTCAGLLDSPKLIRMGQVFSDTMSLTGNVVGTATGVSAAEAQEKALQAGGDNLRFQRLSVMIQYQLEKAQDAVRRQSEHLANMYKAVGAIERYVQSSLRSAAQSSGA